MRKVGWCTAILIVSLILPGCSIDGRTPVITAGGGMFCVFSMGRMQCMPKEVRIYLANYKNLYGSIGETDLWNGDFDVTSMEESIRMLSVQHLARVYSMNLYAKDQDIRLTDKEETQVETAAEAYFDSLSKDEIDYLQVSKRDIEEYYRRYAIAEKVYFGLMDSIDEEISEDEARVMDAYVLFTEDEETADIVEKAIANDEEFDRLCASYSQGKKGQVSFGRGTYDEKVEQIAFSLDNDSCSGRIETDEGYYFIYCINKYNKTKSEENKESIVSARKEQAIEDIIGSQGENYYSAFYDNNLNTIAFDTTGNVTTDSFFSTLDMYLSYGR